MPKHMHSVKHMYAQAHAFLQAYAQALSILDHQRARSSQPEFDRQAHREQSISVAISRSCCHVDLLSRGDVREISSGIDNG